MKKLPQPDAAKIAAQIQSLENGLTGDVKRLTNFTPEYRLLIGRYRALFEVEDNRVVVYRIRHRKEAYRKR
ncbi:MAG: type II toxin-antitoxin system RelE/ParE family toxin [Candidatus Electrothrix sp. MAN1_4]|nr:type II toxin-antitoxin system RelE/ParE family toxin [Candidatus Electrothrix sp. MAN1_4]